MRAARSPVVQGGPCGLLLLLLLMSMLLLLQLLLLLSSSSSYGPVRKKDSGSERAPNA